MKFSVWFAALSLLLIIAWISFRGEDPSVLPRSGQAIAVSREGGGPWAPLPPPAIAPKRIEVRSHLPSFAGQPMASTIALAPKVAGTSAATYLTGKNGQPLRMGQRDALIGCAKLNLRLPTMRELAELAQSRGAKGILEVAQVRPQTAPESLPWEFSLDGSDASTYYLVKVLNPDGKQDLFYYNPRGYLAPELAAERGMLLTSSLNEMGIIHGFGLNGANGVLGGEGEIASTTDQNKPEPGFARCVPKNP